MRGDSQLAFSMYIEQQLYKLQDSPVLMFYMLRSYINLIGTTENNFDYFHLEVGNEC